MTRSAISIAAALSLAVGIGACASTGATSAPAASVPVPRSARFDYAATDCAAPSSMKITLAIIAPTWQQVPTEGTAATASLSFGTGAVVTEMQTRFRTALRDDFLELVTCRGLLTRGPFTNFDSMVFPDRDGSNLLLEPLVESTMKMVGVTRVPRCRGFVGRSLCGLDAVSGTLPASYTVNGTIQLGGRITLTLREPLSSTRMWTRSIEMPSGQVRFIGETVYSAVAATTPDLWADPGVQTALVPALEEAYATVLRAADGHLNPRELQLVAAQAAEVRKKASISIPR
jgi:hypothetical protein